MGLLSFLVGYIEMESCCLSVGYKLQKNGFGLHREYIYTKLQIPTKQTCAIHSGKI